jgi:hypothetical protein
MILPFNFVISVKREIIAGNHRSVLTLLLGKRSGIAPGDAIFLRPSWLLVLLIIIAIGSQVAMMHLTESLKPGAHTNLFTALIEARRLLYLALGIEGLAWYYHALNDLKKICLQAVRPPTALHTYSGGMNKST